MPLSSLFPASHGKTTIEKEASPSECHAFTIEAPTLPTTESRRGLRARSRTSPDHHLSASFSTRLRARTTFQSHQPPLHLELPSNAASVWRSSGTLPTLAEAPSEKPSAPIDIPARKRAEGQVSRPTTPLTVSLLFEVFPPNTYRVLSCKTCLHSICNPLT